jgi:hypothetical protein
MSNAEVSLQELESTVERMELRMSSASEPTVQQLWRLYQELVPRFEADLQFWVEPVENFVCEA